MSCTDCETRACVKFEELPEDCMVNLAREGARDRAIAFYTDPANAAIVHAASQVISPSIAEHWPRVHEIVEFARQIDAKRIGIASCSTFSKEAKMLADILERAGFESVDAMCRIGAIRRIDTGECDETHPKAFASACNPFMQAEVLNQAETDFNIILGLCLGHDMIFASNSNAWVTTLAVKDQSRTHAEIIGDQLEAFLAQG